MSSDDHRPAEDTASDPWAPATSRPDTSVTAGTSAAPRRRRLFVLAMVIFSIGVLFTIVAALTPFVLGRDAPTILYVGAMLFTPVGFLLGLLYAILGSRPPKM
ncbi:hypothetical protein G6016_13770 [Dietzia aerolata]|uniref:Uncharacterized protein n=1 Tax=Dietzia aerolata TaxID=595984 RepID=A0ABV5JKG3_9ACTN|nr:hypothetical protein [Dietzia aerolata]